MKLNDNGKIYNQHDSAFRDIAAWVIVKDGECVATVARKTTGRRSPNGLTVAVYLHVIGLPMVKGIARGGGYSMTDAAVATACSGIKDAKLSHDPKYQGRDMHLLALNERAAKFRAVVDNGHAWTRQLEDMGYSVMQAV